MRILLAGATGAIGRPLVSKLLDRGHEVIAITRGGAAARAMADRGVTPVIADVLDKPALHHAVTDVTADAVISQLTALQKPPVRHRDMAATNQLRTDGTQNLVDVAHQIGARRFITQSMEFGYGYEGDGTPHTEEDHFGPVGRGPWEQHLRAMRVNENLVLDAPGLDGIALRYGLFYGVGAGDQVLVDGLRKRRIPAARGGLALSWIYIDDAVEATIAALEGGTPATAYNIADDDPVSWDTLLTALAAAVGAPRPLRIPRWLLRVGAPYAYAVMRGGVVMSNEKAKAELGWVPTVSSYRQGVGLIAETSRP